MKCLIDGNISVMALIVNFFDSWLNNKLQELKTDESVFSSYIKGILEGDETDDEKSEALEGIISGITEDCIQDHVAQILEAWKKWKPEEKQNENFVNIEDVDVRLAKMLESQSLPTTSQKKYTEEEKRIRQAILAQYSQMSDEDGTDDEDDKNTEGIAKVDSGIEKNTNVTNVIQLEKEKRERAKQESMKKKEKDKEDREKQKQIKEEKKEKRKTQKGERKR